MPEHPFEEKIVTEENHNTRHRLTAALSYTNLVEVFVDNFIAATKKTKLTHLTHFSRAMLYGIHSIFSPAHIPRDIKDRNLSHKINYQKGK